jgi:hypothetical protein
MLGFKNKTEKNSKQVNDLNLNNMISGVNESFKKAQKVTEGWENTHKVLNEELKKFNDINKSYLNNKNLNTESKEKNKTENNEEIGYFKGLLRGKKE